MPGKTNTKRVIVKPIEPAVQHPKKVGLQLLSQPTVDEGVIPQLDIRAEVKDSCTTNEKTISKMIANQTDRQEESVESPDKISNTDGKLKYNKKDNQTDQQILQEESVDSQILPDETFFLSEFQASTYSNSQSMVDQAIINQHNQSIEDQSVTNPDSQSLSDSSLTLSNLPDCISVS